MKGKWLLAFLMVVVAIFTVGCSCTTDEDNNSSGQNTEQNGDTGNGSGDNGNNGDGLVSWTISYQAAPASEIDERVLELIKMRLGNYPTNYVEGVGVTVDNLRSDVLDSEYLYTFHGWYYDASCLQACENGVIGKDKTGDVVLYAKVQKTPISQLDKEDWGS